MHQQDLTTLDDFLDFIFASERHRAAGFDLLGIVSAQGLDAGGIGILAVAAVQGLGLGLGLGLRCLLFRQQFFAVGDRNLIIIGMDFAERQEPVAVTAVIDKRRLQGRFDPGYLGKIDVASELPSGFNLDVEIFQMVSDDDRHPGLFRMRCVDEHSFGGH